jgi:hypothetical protein
MAQATTPTGSPSTTATTSYNVFSAIASSNPGNGGNFGVQPGNVASDPTNQAGQNAAGASGSSDGSINLSTGVTVAIIVVVCLVVLLGGEHTCSPPQLCRVPSLTVEQQAAPFSSTLQRNDNGRSETRYVVRSVESQAATAQRLLGQATLSAASQEVW